MDSLAELGAAAVPRLIEALEYEKVRPEVIYMLRPHRSGGCPGNRGPGKAGGKRGLAQWRMRRSSPWGTSAPRERRGARADQGPRSSR